MTGNDDELLEDGKKQVVTSGMETGPPAIRAQAGWMACPLLRHYK